LSFSDYAPRMATKISMKSDGDTWVFEVGKTATFTDKSGKSHLGDFTVTGIRLDGSRPVIETDLKRISRYDWTNPIMLAGGFEILE
jgi:hypothetical protein